MKWNVAHNEKGEVESVSINNDDLRIIVYKTRILAMPESFSTRVLVKLSAQSQSVSIEAEREK